MENKVRELLEEGKKYTEEEKYDLAEERLNEANKLLPDNDEIYIAFGDLKFYQNKYKEAEEFYIKAKNLSLNNIEVYTSLGLLSFKKENYDLAEKFFKETIEKFPNDINGYNGLIIVYKKKQNYNNLKKIYKEIIKKFPNDINNYLELCELYFEKKDYASAERAYKETMEKFPDNINSFFGLGNLYFEKKDYNSAERVYKEAIKKFPDDIDSYLELSTLYFEKKDYDSVEKIFKEVIEKFPDDLNSFIGLGKLYLDKNKNELLENLYINYEEKMDNINNKLLGEILLKLALFSKKYENYIAKICDKKLYLNTKIFDDVIDIYTGKRDNEIGHKNYSKLKSILKEKILDNENILKDLKECFKAKKSSTTDGVFYMYKNINENIIRNLIFENIYKNKVDNFNDPFDPYFKRYDKEFKIIEKLKEVKITCFSKEKNNILLWAHYGNNHKGICLGYKLEKINTEESFFGKVEYIGIKTKKRKIILNPIEEKESNLKNSYIDDKFQLLNSNTFTMNYQEEYRIDEDISFADIFLRKHDSWKYEKEYRLIHFPTFNKNDYYEKVELVEVIFGIDTTEADKKLIKKLLKHNKKIKFFQTTQEEGLNLKVVEI